MVGRLVKSMYGTQDASHIWQLDYVDLLCSASGGFRRGRHSAALFHNEGDDVKMAVHGDDFVCLSDDDGLEHIDKLLKSKYTAKDMGTLGFETKDDKQLMLLNRVFRIGHDHGEEFVEIEPDMRHAPLIVAEAGCDERTKSVTTPREKLKDDIVREGHKTPLLKPEATTRYRSACMRLSYLAQDRLDLAEAAKNLAQRMSAPREFDLGPLKRVARYLRWRPRAAIRFRRQKFTKVIVVLVDSDFAGDALSRKSTTGLVALVGGHLVKSSSTLQSLIALSVGEAEFYAVVKGAAIGLSLRAIYSDYGMDMEVEIHSDSTTAGSLTDRLGAGPRTNHLDTRYLWVQERVQDKDLRVVKVHTSKNLSDAGTKPVTAKVLEQHCLSAGMVFYDEAPKTSER